MKFDTTIATAETSLNITLALAGILFSICLSSTYVLFLQLECMLPQGLT